MNQQTSRPPESSRMRSPPRRTESLQNLEADRTRTKRAKIAPTSEQQSRPVPSSKLWHSSPPRAQRGRDGDKSAIEPRVEPPTSSTNPSDPRYPNIYLQPESRPITQEQLAAEVKSIYSGLTMVEAKCIHVDAGQSAAIQNGEHWQALIALHRTLLHEHHDFFLASQHPSASPALKRLACKYSMPARMWKHGIHSFLELLRNRLPQSREYMKTYIYFAYHMMALLYETVPSFEDTWIECLRDLGRYRAAIEDDQRERDNWVGVTQYWYGLATDREPSLGRLYHHLAILARPEHFQQIYYYCRSLTCTQLFTSCSIDTFYAKTHGMTLYTPKLALRRTSNLNVPPHVHILLGVLIILSDIQSIPPSIPRKYVDSILDGISGEGLSSTTTLACSDEFGSHYKTGILQPENVDIGLLPEDYLLRGQAWVRTLYPTDWWSDEVVEAEEKSIEHASTTEIRPSIARQLERLCLSKAAFGSLDRTLPKNEVVRKSPSFFRELRNFISCLTRRIQRASPALAIGTLIGNLPIVKASDVAALVENPVADHSSGFGDRTLSDTIITVFGIGSTIFIILVKDANAFAFIPALWSSIAWLPIRTDPGFADLEWTMFKLSALWNLAYNLRVVRRSQEHHLQLLVQALLLVPSLVFGMAAQAFRPGSMMTASLPCWFLSTFGSAIAERWFRTLSPSANSTLTPSSIPNSDNSSTSRNPDSGRVRRFIRARFGLSNPDSMNEERDLEMQSDDAVNDNTNLTQTSRLISPDIYEMGSSTRTGALPELPPQESQAGKVYIWQCCRCQCSNISVLARTCPQCGESMCAYCKPGYTGNRTIYELGSDGSRETTPPTCHLESSNSTLTLALLDQPTRTNTSSYTTLVPESKPRAP